MIIDRKDQKRITRKSSEYWSQNCEIDFILYDFPVECVKLGFDFQECISKYVQVFKLRKIPENWNREGILEYAIYAMKNAPRVWNIGELKEGKRNFQWGIKYPGREAVEYTSY